ncbi:YgjV family protein [Sedimentibacter sp.]|uniref:YgjV family protein n=1 Tax=Sedimentibacter sp. TaxID=1960295 RepID=UPI000EEADA51|nr:YgjV family protein [Sedimentibacter sp.]HCX63281.1 YgjV family protein [Clostridiales bacterium]
MYQFITQTVGFVGTGIMFLSYQCKDSKKLFLMQMLSNVAYTLHFFMLGAMSGSMNIIVSMMRNFALLNSKHKWARNKYWLWLFIGLHLIIVTMTWNDVFSLLPAIGMIAMAVSSWTRNGKKVRMANLFINSPAWLIYDIHVRSYAGIFCEVLLLLSVIISFIRYGVKALDHDN